jgi:hypothetical protein
MITQIQVSQIDYIEIEQIQIVVLTNVFVPGDMSIDDFALALDGSIGWLQCFKQLWECRYHSLLWSMYTCSFIVHTSSFRIALPVMHRRTSVFFGVLGTADSRHFCLIALFVLAIIPKVPLLFDPKLLCRFAFSSTTWRGPTFSSKYEIEPFGW